MPTSKRVGRTAGKLLSTSKSKAFRSVAGSALRQERKTKPKRKKSTGLNALPMHSSTWRRMTGYFCPQCPPTDATSGLDWRVPSLIMARRRARRAPSAIPQGYARKLETGEAGRRGS